MPMIFGKSNLKDKIKETLTSWRMLDVVDMARKDERVIYALVELLDDKDDNVKKRSLKALELICKKMGPEEREKLIKKSLGKILDIAGTTDESLKLQALKTLKALIMGVSLKNEDFILLSQKMRDIITSSNNELTHSYIAEVLENVILENPSKDVISMLDLSTASDDPYITAACMKIMYNLARSSKNTDLIKKLISKIPALLEREDSYIVESVLETIKGLAYLPLTKEDIEKLPVILTKVKKLLKKEDWIIRKKAQEVITLLEGIFSEYYRSRREEAIEKINELLSRGMYMEAIDLAISIGDKYTLEWLSEVLERVLNKPSRIGGLVLSHPVYALPKPKISEKGKPPLLHEFKVPRHKTPKALRMMEQWKGEQEGKGNPKLEEYFERMGKLKVESILEMLDEEEKRMDALREIYKLSEELDEVEMRKLSQLIPKLFNIAKSKNSWIRIKAVRALANLTKIDGSIVDVMRKWLHSKDETSNIAALNFFEYYFSKRWSDEIALEVMERMPHFLKNRETMVHAFYLLESMSRKIPKERMHMFDPIIPILKKQLEILPKPAKEIIFRILENVSS